MRVLASVTIFVWLMCYEARAQMFPPGTFSIDGIPIVCGPITFVLTPNVPDVGINNGQGQIYLNPMILGRLPTVLRLFWAAHECGHFFAGANEIAADCWAIKTGRNQGWFPPQAFGLLMQMFQNNPGDMLHPAGPTRVSNMMVCYQT